MFPVGCYCVNGRTSGLGKPLDSSTSSLVAPNLFFSSSSSSCGVEPVGYSHLFNRLPSLIHQSLLFTVAFHSFSFLSFHSQVDRYTSCRIRDLVTTFFPLLGNLDRRHETLVPFSPDHGNTGLCRR